MSSERDLKAEIAFKEVPWQYVNNVSFNSVYLNGFKKGWDQALQSEEINKLREENTKLREALEKTLDKVKTMFPGN